MRLSKLTLAGFKSFADRTEFTFDAPITGIVGPNGCGKSNVVDAIKWVLGERSAKSLRGKEMIDVIFAGSAARPPQGMASVVLTFDNPELDDATLAAIEARRGPEQVAAEEAALDAEEPGEAATLISRTANRRRLLPVDTDAVDVERRLYRDGTSQYLINGKRARLKDIRDLFLDTGVGADAYSIIEQGKVDSMLLANPVERRTFFEEAAGVSRFKARRIEAQRKLERAEVNLVRIREQLDAADRRLRMVKGQAVKARKFVELDAELKAIRMALAFELYDDLRTRLNGLTSQLMELESARAGAGRALEEAESTKQNAELARHDAIDKLRTTERDRASAEHRLASAQQRLAMTERAASEGRQQHADETRRLESLELQLGSLGREIEAHTESVEELAVQLARTESALRECSAARETAQTALAEQRLKLAERRAAVGNIDREQTGLAARLEADQRRLSAMTEQQTRLHARSSALERDQEETAHQLALAESAAGERRSRIADLDGSIGAAVASIEALTGDQRSRAARLGELEQQHARLDSRRATLHEMIEARVGLGEAVKFALSRRDADARERPDSFFASLLGPLAELVHVEAVDATAVEAALGGLAQALIVPTLTGLMDAADLAQLPGRVTFLSIDAPGAAAVAGAMSPAAVPHLDDAYADDLPAGRADDDDEEGPTLGRGGAWAIVDPLAALIPHHAAKLESLVHAPSHLKPLVERLLRRTYLVPDLESARLLMAGPAAGLGCRFITRSGEVLEEGGKVTIGPMRDASHGDGLISRRSELAELEARLAELDASIAEGRAELSRIDTQAAGMNEELSRLRIAMAAEQRSLVAEESRRQKHLSEIDRIARERPLLADELRQTEGRIEALRAEHAVLADKGESLRRLLDEQQALARQLEQEIESAQAAADAAAEKLTAIRVEAGQVSEKLGASRRELRRLELAREEAGSTRLRLSESIQRREATLAEYTGVIDQCRDEAAEADQQMQRLAASIDDRARAVDLAAQACSRHGEVLIAARQRAQNIERDWQALELTKRELEVRREAAEQRAQEELSLDLAWEYNDYRAMIAGDAGGDGRVRRIDIEQSQREAEALKDAIKKLGNVNLDAITEESTLEARNEELIKQVADIDRACAQLRELIEKLSNVSRERFKESFERIQEFFSSERGMFRRLFGGGKADIKLLPVGDTGEIDWLESGIEITAKPPGKEPRSISQLSGGEKTMTAVALLMSIFQSKPSPFCVLDEVDAALDDANVERFAGILRQFLDRCHFIVITHNKKTMQVADQMYGVTMQERGVSRRVRVRFEQIGENGKIELEARTGDSEANRARQQAGQASLAAIDSVNKPTLSSEIREKLARMRRGRKPVEVGGEVADSTSIPQVASVAE